jgi:alpha-L-fucosidase
MLDLSPDRTGLIPPTHASRYKELGDFIRSCYGTSVLPSERFTSDNSLLYIQLFDSTPVTVDRSVIQEDQTHGQVIRAYTVDVQLVNATYINQWTTVAQGTSITKTVDTPVIKAFTVHLCN